MKAFLFIWEWILLQLLIHVINYYLMFSLIKGAFVMEFLQILPDKKINVRFYLRFCQI